MQIKVLTKAMMKATPERVTVADEPFETKVIDWNDSSDRKWLQNHMHWAMHNGRVVLLRQLNYGIN